MGKVNNEYIFKSEDFYGEIIVFDKEKNDIRCTIWQPLSNDNDKNFGLCWDFEFGEVKKLKELISSMSLATPDKIGIYEPDEEDRHWKNFEEKQKSWWYKFKWYLRDIGLHIEPFRWKFSIDSKSDFYTVKNCIFSFGPIKITWGKIRNAKK